MVPNPLLVTPIRDVNDTVVMQTAVIGEANVLYTKDRFYLSLRRCFQKGRNSGFGRLCPDETAWFLIPRYEEQAISVSADRSLFQSSARQNQTSFVTF